VHTASLAAGAIDNAKLYEGTRRRVEALTTLTQLSQALAAVTLRADLHDAVTHGARDLLGADSCHIYRLDAETDELSLVASDPAEAPAPSPRVLWPDPDGDGLLAVPLVAGEQRLGILCCLAVGRRFTREDAELLRAVANQTAVGLEKAALIERLTAENIVKDMFDALAAGSAETAAVKAGEARCDLSRPHVFVHAERAPEGGEGDGAWPELASRLEARLRRLCPRAFFDARHDGVRALAPLASPAEPEAVEQLRQACDELGREEGLVVGLSDKDRGPASARRRMREAADAARIGRSLAAAGGAVCYEQLGAYRYLVHLELDRAPHDRYRQAVEELIDYDARRRTRLVETLERFLGERGSVAASARTLYIHPNTVRQRIERIERVAGLDLREEDLLSTHHAFQRKGSSRSL